MKLKDIVAIIEEFAPLAYQESYDNSGVQIGFPDQDIHSVLITLDVTEAVVDEAIANNHQLIISHHPLLFKGIKRITSKTEIERIMVKAIKNNIAIYAAHTNVDMVKNGVSWKMAQKLELENIETLEKASGLLKKLVVFVPTDYVEKVRDALFNAGAGNVGNYANCSFNSEGYGSFMANDEAKPFVGEIGSMHFEPEVKVEIIFPAFKQAQIIDSLCNAHPYEEVAYDIYPVENKHSQVGLGVVGILKAPMETVEFLEKLRSIFNCKTIRYTDIVAQKVSKIALCGGSGSSLLSAAIAAGADVFVSADFKYHQFFESENKIVIADVGHYESEQFTKELFYEIVTKKISTFAVHLSRVDTNPIRYMC